jgi:hypothetical protein
LELSNEFDCVSQKENILLNTENKRIIGVLTVDNLSQRTQDNIAKAANDSKHEGICKATPIYVMEVVAATANPGHRRDWMAKKEVSKSIINTNPLGKQLKKVIWQQDEDGKTTF